MWTTIADPGDKAAMEMHIRAIVKAHVGTHDGPVDGQYMVGRE
jgi:hypothetical protein